MKDKINDLLSEFENESHKPKTQNDVLDLRSKYIGKKGSVSLLMGNLRNLSVDEKREVGPLLNSVKNKIFEETEKLITKISFEEINEKLRNENVDINLRDRNLVRGPKSAGVHPITQIQDRIEDIFVSGV